MAEHDLFARLVPAVKSLAPYLPMSLHLIVSALVPIYTGSHASLSRPSSAATPPKRKRRHGKRRSDGKGDGAEEEEDDDDTSSEDDEDDDEPVMKMEGLSPSDAVLFPVLAGCTLAGLYLLIKYVGPQLLNRILGAYFSFMACFSVGKLASDTLRVAHGFVWPRYYVDQGRMWLVRQADASVEEIGSLKTNEGPSQRRRQPLPGRLGRLELGESSSRMLWTLRGLLDKQYLVKLRVKGATALKVKVSVRNIAAFLFGVGVVLYANFVSTPWYLTNLQGFAFTYSALQLLSPTTFGTGSLILVGLFFYDIYFVFYTPLMVSVATNLDVPIKMLFPRPEVGEKKPSLAMLGLGDIVLPGIMIGLSLRFDLYLHYLRQQKTKQSTGSDDDQSEAAGTPNVEKVPYVSVTTKWGERIWTRGWSDKVSLRLPSTRKEPKLIKAAKSTESTKTVSDILPRFKSTYFNTAIVGYVIGMSTTLVVMHAFKHAQPALLYLVPGVLGAVWLTAAVRGEIKEMWEYSEVVEEEDKDDKEKSKEGTDGKPEKGDDNAGAKKSSWLGDFFGTSFFGQAKMDRNEKKLSDALSKRVQTGDSSDGESQSEDKTATSSDSTAKKSNASYFEFSFQPVASKPHRATRSKNNPSESSTDQPKSRSVSGSGSDDAVLVSKEDVADEPGVGTTTATPGSAGTRKSTRSRRA